MTHNTPKNTSIINGLVKQLGQVYNRRCCLTCPNRIHDSSTHVAYSRIKTGALDVLVGNTHTCYTME